MAGRCYYLLAAGPLFGGGFDGRGSRGNSWRHGCRVSVDARLVVSLIFTKRIRQMKKTLLIMTAALVAQIGASAFLEYLDMRNKAPKKDEQ